VNESLILSANCGFILFAMKEALGRIILFGRMRTALHGRHGMIAVAMKLAAADPAYFL
jgi:hypothetical protein